jgi:hypothetical protein
MLMASLLLAACASNPVREPVTRQIPGPPEYLRPVPVPPATKGKSSFVVSEERAAVIEHQNIVIVGARNAWQKMKDTYSKSFLKKRMFGGS